LVFFKEPKEKKMIRTILMAAVFALAIAVTGSTASAARTSGFFTPSPNARTTATGVYKVAQRRCRSLDSIVRRLARRGFYNVHKIKPKSYSIKLRAYKRGMRYRVKLERCSGNILWAEPMPK